MKNGLRSNAGLFFVWVAVSVCLAAGLVRQPNAPESGFPAESRVYWTNSPDGPEATRVHPLMQDNRLLAGRLRRGDRLARIDHVPVYDAEAANTLLQSAQPGTVFALHLMRVEPILQTRQEQAVFLTVGHRHAFGHNEVGLYWRAEPWWSGFSLLAVILLLLIVTPVARANLRANRGLLALLATGTVLWVLVLLHHAVAVLATSWDHTLSERLFALGLGSSMLLYAGLYISIGQGKSHQWLLPVLLGAAGVSIFLTDQWRQWLVSWEAAVWSLVAGYTALGLLRQAGAREYPRVAHALGVASLALCALWVAATWYAPLAPHTRASSYLLLLLPVLDASFAGIRFGKTSIVVTQAIGYAFVFLTGVAGLLAIAQLTELLLPAAPYRLLLTAAFFVLSAIVARLLYKANAAKIRRYLTSAQQARTDAFRGFISRIPQHADLQRLCSAIERDSQSYFGAQQVHMQPATDAWVELAQALYVQGGLWSQRKELSPVRLATEHEDLLTGEDYALALVIAPDDQPWGLLLLGPKKRGVYNLADVELLAQLVQQAQLAMSVLRLAEQQKDLLRQTYEANLTALRAQINPHFLFNTLNTISALIHDAPGQAEAAIEKLAFIFRYTLKRSSADFVSLEEELGLVRTYLEIEQLRFGARLEVSVSLPTALRSVQVPAFIIQTFAENCIKHGIGKMVTPGKVQIRVWEDASGVWVETYDSGPGIDLARVRSSTGLSNALDRMKTLYQREDLIHIENTGQGTRITLLLPA